MEDVTLKIKPEMLARIKEKIDSGAFDPKIEDITCFSIPAKQKKTIVRYNALVPKILVCAKCETPVEGTNRFYPIGWYSCDKCNSVTWNVKFIDVEGTTVT